MNYWQISAGDGDTNLVDIFIKLNVALIGPGAEGDYFDNKNEYEKMGRDGDLVKVFAEEVQIGDRFILKHIKNPNTQTWKILAVGEVISPYRFEPIFDKVDSYSWDVQHCRRVKWYVPKDEVLVDKGGAPIRIQKLGENNPMRKRGEELFNELIQG
ncbi:hypothetical protein M2651_07240 [Clostridium sp. SYSU_GA19001]|uniref:hypothetical protein n=1 Tax=Clostridium caldaquaticum TaxID=2940653 RepID=UPI002076F31D|nr:hypothetical protein [Clostridium caldaquaticum]MCM8710820.1 hypothetical protein [Clostridium caldaquaticum]